MAEVITPDVCVIGAGSGGTAAATEALGLGASVVVIERGRIGGTRLHAGSLVARALSEAARRAHAQRSGKNFGLGGEEPAVDFARLRNHLREVLAGAQPAVSAEHLVALGARLLAGEARFLDQRTVRVGEETLVRPRRFIIATGSSPRLPAIPGLDSAPFFTTETIFENVRRPTHLVIIGAGPAGIELGQAFRRLGADVTVIDQGRPLAEADPELADVALRRIVDEGVLIRPDTEVTAVAAREGGGAVITIESEGVQQTISASHLLVTTGRLPNLDLDIDRAGIRRHKSDPNRLELSPSLRTSNSRVYAIGDVVAGVSTSEAAVQHARIAIRSALLGLRMGYEARLVPIAFYTDPEIAWVGMGEEQARQRFGEGYRVIRRSFAENDRARAGRESSGMIKVIAAPDGRIAGAGIVGPEAGELIALFSFAIANRLGAAHLARFTAPYPTLSETARRVGLEAAAGLPKPPWLDWLFRLGRVLP